MGKRVTVTIVSSGQSVTLSLAGSLPSGGVRFQLPRFVDDIASSSAGAVTESSGTVLLSGSRTVTVRLRRG